MTQPFRHHYDGPDESEHYAMYAPLGRGSVSLVIGHIHYKQTKSDGYDRFIIYKCLKCLTVASRLCLPVSAGASNRGRRCVRCGWQATPPISLPILEVNMGAK